MMGADVSRFTGVMGSSKTLKSFMCLICLSFLRKRKKIKKHGRLWNIVTLTIPLSIKNKLIGHVAFVNSTEAISYSNEELMLLKLITEIFAES
jgi:hypothetical protein